MTSASLLVQLEYARKRTGGYGRWSLVTVGSRPQYAWLLGVRVPRQAFTPVPRTDAAVLRTDRRPRPLLPPERLPAYREFVAHGFTAVGGSLGATLARRYRTRQVRAAFDGLGTDPGTPVGLVHRQCGSASSADWADAPGPLPGQRGTRTTPSWMTETASRPSRVKIRPLASPRPPWAVGDSWS